MMAFTVMFTVTTTLVLLFSPSAYSQSPPSPILSPTPAPAPAPPFVNLTKLLGVAGPFSIFLNYIEKTKVIETFQNQANNTEEGITIFVPKDSSFTALKNPSLKNLTQDQLKSVFLFHALPHFYSLADFKTLSQTNPVPTFAGSQYTLNFTDVSGTVHMTSSWSNTTVSSAVYSTHPVALYQVDKVLLPVAIFGTDIPPTPAPAPAPAPEIAPAADTVGGGNKSSPATATPSGTNQIVSLGRWIVLAVLGGMVFLL